MPRLAIAVWVAIALIGAGCSADPADDGRIRVVATTTILGDVASNVAGSDADVEVLVPIGASPPGVGPSSARPIEFAREESGACSARSNL